MTKRLLAITLVVLVAVSAMYLPSVLSVSAADEFKIIDKDAYEAYTKTQTDGIQQYTFIVDGNYFYEYLKPTEYATAAAIEAYAKKKFSDADADKTVINVVATPGVERSFTVTTSAKYTVTLNYWEQNADGKTINKNVTDSDDRIVKAKFSKGDAFSTVYAALPLKAPVAISGQFFTGWEAVNGNGFDNTMRVNGNIKFTAKYSDVAASPSRFEILEFYPAKSTATVLELTSGAYAPSSTSVDVDNVRYVDGVKGDNRLAYGMNNATLTPDITTGGVKYVFNSWKQLNSVPGRAVYPTTSPYSTTAAFFVATYKVETPEKSYKYTVDNVAISHTSNSIDTDLSILKQDKLDELKAFAQQNDKRLIGLKIASIIPDVGGKFSTVNLVPEYKALTSYNYYYLDADKNPTTKLVKEIAETYTPTDLKVDAVDGFTFDSWQKATGTTNDYNAKYKVGNPEPEKPVVPEEKGDDAFAFASTAKPKTAVLNKTMVARVTAGKSTFDKEQVKIVNKNTTVKVKPVNCTAKVGTMVETSGTPVTISFNKKGIAYVIATVRYNGESYTKILTKTVK